MNPIFKTEQGGTTKDRKETNTRDNISHHAPVGFSGKISRMGERM